MKRRGKHLMLGPLDWSLMESWKSQEIPLRIVLRGIDNVFDSIEQSAKKSSRVKSLSYCKEEVEELFEEWRSSQTGKHTQKAEANTSAFEQTEDLGGDELRELFKRLNDLAKVRESDELLENLLNQIDALIAADITESEIELKLGELEIEVKEKLFENASRIERVKLLQEVEAEAGIFASKMNHEEVAKLREKLLIKKMFEESGIPRLSLYRL